MAETETTMPFAQRTKLVLKDLGDPASIAGEPVEVKSYVLGRLIGIARGIVTRTDDKNGQVYEGLKGEFRSIPSEREIAKGREPLESGICYIPDAFHNMVAAALAKAQENDRNAEINFAFEVIAVRASNPAGRSWEFRPLLPVKAENRLDALMGEVQKALPAPKVKEIDNKKK